MPRNDLTSDTLVGIGHVCIMSIFRLSTMIPSSEIKCPRYSTFLCIISYFIIFAYNLCYLSFVKIYHRYSIYSFFILLYTKMSSKYITMNLSKYSWNILFINIMNIASAFVNPKGKMTYSKYLYQVLKAIFGISSFLMQI